MIEPTYYYNGKEFVQVPLGDSNQTLRITWQAKMRVFLYNLKEKVIHLLDK